ncbi:MAG: P-loop NTPase [Eubacteriales bacterium]
MKEILIVSGKGGTGKTSITGAIASLSHNSVFADCDVDAADLHLILKPETKEKYEFISGHTANIIENQCISCGICLESCRFDAIKKTDNKYMVDPIMCEGCGVCTWVCQEKAIDFVPSLCGHYYVSDTRFGSMVHAKLSIAAENSGKLVSEVRRKAREIASSQKSDYIVIDGPPGIGCPVIASMTGVDSVIVVTEPTVSGVHDMQRVLDLAKHFSISSYVCINKYDINEDVTAEIAKMLTARNIPLIGKVPYDQEITNAQIHKKTIIEFSKSEASKSINEMWNKYINIINNKE